jgi:Kef-type K+ transport system membrane component KefB
MMMTSPLHAMAVLGLLLVLNAKLTFNFAQRGWPPLVAELAVGMALAALGWVSWGPWVPLLTELGLVVLLLESGLQSHWQSLAQQRKLALLLGTLGVVLPLVGGFGAAMALGSPWPQALLMGASLSATSIGLSAKRLAEEGELQSPLGQTILAAAVVDDVLGLLLLSALTFWLGSGAPPAHAALSAWPVGILAATLSLLAWGVWRAKRTPNKGPTPLQNTVPFGVLLQPMPGGLAVLGGVLLLCSLLQQVLGVNIALSAFGLGLALQALGQHTTALRPPLKALEGLMPALQPLFLLGVGVELVHTLQANAAALTRTPWWWTVTAVGVLTTVAVATKVLAAWPLRGHGLPWQRLGWGMVPRGEVGLLFMQVGLSAGLLQPAWAPVLVLTLILTCVIAPPQKKA